MDSKNQKKILEKAEQANLGDTPVSLFMSTNLVSLKANYTVKNTIETFRIHHISGAPVVDYQNKVIGVISEYDLLVQAASKTLSGPINFKSNIISVFPETTLKEVLVILYKQKLKWMPVVNQHFFLKGIVARIDVLSFIAKNSDL